MKAKPVVQEKQTCQRYCDKYEGEVNNGKRQGYGKFTYAGDRCDKGYTRGIPKNTVYEGIWGITGEGYSRLTGEGSISYPNGVSFGGIFLNDKIQNGKGFVKFPNQNKVEGNWINNYTMCAQGTCENGFGVSYYFGSQLDNSHVSTKIEGNFKSFKVNGNCKVETQTLFSGNPLIFLQVSSDGSCQNSRFYKGQMICDKRKAELYNHFYKYQLQLSKRLHLEYDVKLILR